MGKRRRFFVFKLRNFFFVAKVFWLMDWRRLSIFFWMHFFFENKMITIYFDYISMDFAASFFLIIYIKLRC